MTLYERKDGPLVDDLKYGDDYGLCDVCDTRWFHESDELDHCGECGNCLEHCDDKPEHLKRLMFLWDGGYEQGWTDAVAEQK